MYLITYKDLVVRYGKSLALRLLNAIEQHGSGLCSNVVDFDQEVRMQKALAALKEVKAA